MGSYANIESGRLVEALGLLTGAPCEELDLRGGSGCDGGDESSGERQPLDTELLWGKVISYDSAGFLMGASCSSRGPRGEDEGSHRCRTHTALEESKQVHFSPRPCANPEAPSRDRERAAAAEAMGLITDHAYSLLAVMALGSVRLVKLRNPWGRREWRVRLTLSLSIADAF